ncbi:MAG: DUF4126 domain-containing protein [Acidobacteria bacterium]|nr:DUF4126 domain-containing protein [Acidobacteriota bacterium]
MSAEWITTAATAMGSAWLSCINLYATVVTLGLLQRFEWVKLPGELGMLSSWWFIGLAGGLYLVEFVADKIPAVDTAWDAIHTFIRIPAGAIMAATAFAEFDPAIKMAAMIIGGSLALGSHGTKAATRLAANASPEPFSNITLSIIEDVITFASTILMAFYPVLILIVIAIFLIVALWIVPKIVRALRRMIARLKSLFGAEAEVPT